MDEKSYFVDRVDRRVIEGQNLIIPKAIAKITLCGAFEIPVYDHANWNPPTPEQIKNLKEMLNIDVKLIGEDDESRNFV